MYCEKKFIIKYFTRQIPAVILVITLLISLSGCKGFGAETGEVDQSNTAKAGTVQLYHITDTAVEPDEERYQLMQPDNLSAALEEIIEQMKPIDGMPIDRFSIDESGNVSLYIILSDNVSEEVKLLGKAAIVRSVQGLDVKDVVITFQDEAGNVYETATYTDASFYYYSE